MADEQQLVSEFTSVTGVDEERARFFLQASNWELHSALSMFYDEGNDETLSDIKEGSNIDTVGIMSHSSHHQQSHHNSKTSNFATLSSYNKENSSDEEGEEGQAFYAGGSETSGQQILGPNKKKNKDIVQALFNAAKEHGAEAVTNESTKKNSHVFSGVGFTLGSNVTPSEQIGQSLSEPHIKEAEQPKITIKFWKDGFSVDDGPLRNNNDPKNKEFLNAVGRGEIPLELRKNVHDGGVHVNMEDHSDENYVKPKMPKPKPFSGKGHMLGSPTPNIVSKEVEKPLPPQAALRVPSQPVFQVDDSKPVTTIQIRFADGTKLVSRFNTENTVGDIRNVVRNAVPGQGNFKIMTTFPNKVLEDDSVTIEDAKLKNAVIVQRMI